MSVGHRRFFVVIANQRSFPIKIFMLIAVSFVLEGLNGILFLRSDQTFGKSKFWRHFLCYFVLKSGFSTFSSCLKSWNQVYNPFLTDFYPFWPSKPSKIAPKILKISIFQTSGSDISCGMWSGNKTNDSIDFAENILLNLICVQTICADDFLAKNNERLRYCGCEIVCHLCNSEPSLEPFFNTHGHITSPNSLEPICSWKRLRNIQL